MLKKLVKVSYYGIALIAFITMDVVMQTTLDTWVKWSIAAILSLFFVAAIYLARPSIKKVVETFTWSALIGFLFFFSGVINVLALTGSFYMMQIYDRVLPSRSGGTLLVISSVALFLYVAQGYLDILRTRILSRVGNIINTKYQDKVYYNIIESKNGAQSVRDLDTCKSFLSSSGPASLFDLPWIPVYIGLISAFNPFLGVIVFGGAVFLIGVAYLSDRLTKNGIDQTTRQYAERNQIIESCRRNREILKAMGLYNVFKNRWVLANEDYLTINQQVSDFLNRSGNISKVFRAILQSAMLGYGAYLVIHDQATGGVIIAASIISARALAPIDMAIANWKNLSNARAAWKRLNTLEDPMAVQKFELPAPCKNLIVDSITVNAPDTVNRIIHGVSFSLRAGQAACIIGESGSGKSTLARGLVGAWDTKEGSIRLDGADLKQWGHSLSKHIGYLPQDVELFPGTVAQNICRFDPNAKDEDIIAAAKIAGCHDMIVSLTFGYLSQINDAGNNLSAGQRQRIGLARALYNNPFLLVLDEPNANLDLQGEQALSKAVLSVRQRQGIVIIITHRQSILAVSDMMGVMENGMMTMFGYRTELMKVNRNVIAKSA